MTRQEALEEIKYAANMVSGLAAEMTRASTELQFQRDEEAVYHLGVIMEKLHSARCYIGRAHASANRQFEEGASWTISGRKRKERPFS